jgi:hypothetical protein
MVLIKNVATTSKGDWYLRAQQYRCLTKVIDEATPTCLFKLHNKLSTIWLALREVNSFIFIFFKNILKVFFKFKEYFLWCQMFIYRSFIIKNNEKVKIIKYKNKIIFKIIQN